ncbi:MAG TPA: purine-nucleoside phosphorylase [bacterium]|nr:purine-nucleoside phosphorylase [bacterium]
MNLLTYRDRIERAADYIRTRLPAPPAWCVVLGSGLGGLGDRLADPVMKIAYHRIPGFPKTTVHGHAGTLAFGYSGECGVAVMEGRFHGYEGHDTPTLVLPVRVMISIGVRFFFITNAAGGIRSDLIPGDLMLISDHLNLMGANPLTGPNLDEFGPRFPAMTDCYDPELRHRVLSEASSRSLEFKQGVYAALPGPNYETDAEIEMLRRLGADAVGMSTVPEVLAIRHAGRRVVAVSLITNATGGGNVPTHEEVVEMADRRRPELHRIIGDTIAHTPVDSGDTR